MNQMFEVIDKDEAFNNGFKFNPDTRDFIDGYLYLSFYFDFELKLLNVSYNDQPVNVKVSKNDDNLYIDAANVIINKGDTLHFRYKVLEDSPLSITGVFRLEIEDGEDLRSIPIESELRVKRLSINTIDSTTGILYVKGRDVYNSMDRKVATISEPLGDVEDGGYLPDIDNKYTVGTFTFANTEYLLNYKDNIIYSINNINIDDLVSDAEFEISLYNAFNDDKMISSIDEVNVYDLEYSLSDDNIRMYRSTTLNLVIKKDGEIDNNGYLQFNFTDGTHTRLYLSYSRQNILDLLINETGSSQMFTYNTEVLRTMDNKEERINKIQVPFFTLQLRFETYGLDKVKLENLLRNTQDQKFNMPLYNESFSGFVNGDKVNGNFKHTNINVGDNIYIIKSKNEKYVIKVKEIVDSVIVLNQEVKFEPSHCIVYPLVYTKFSKLNNAIRYNGKYAEYNLIFDIILNGKNNLDTLYNIKFETIDGLPFYDFLINNSATPTSRSFDRNVHVLSNGMSNDIYFYNNNKSLTRESFDLTLANKKEIAKIKKAFSDSRGMFGEFYILKPDIDVLLDLGITKDSNVLYVKDTGNEESFLADEYEYLMIKTKYEENIIVKIEDVQKIGNQGVEAIYLDKTFDKTYVNDDIYGIYPILRARFDNDTLTLNYETSTVANTRIELMYLR